MINRDIALLITRLAFYTQVNNLIDDTIDKLDKSNEGLILILKSMKFTDYTKVIDKNLYLGKVTDE